ncbi:hypothetical protein FIBSPDRAFT_865115 [Athelia psychrophila]|uniref:DUF7729 domain-containing protein n=1 Tax=Athelia psychrophila TaxID=1759441 RepID=A0A166FX28_9AGAM|nr:hypothetical protein FIBSPDRAFT_865115 [Fibularhizoctonia sp. CBS 109695]
MQPTPPTSASAPSASVSIGRAPHPYALDALSPQEHRHECGLEHTARLGVPHEHHPPGATSVAPASTTQPTTPAATTPTTTSPALPTPFPQSLDDTIYANFSSMRCEAFFLHMTAAPTFRKCRRFSLRLQSSSEFTDVCIYFYVPPLFPTGLPIATSKPRKLRSLRFVLLPIADGRTGHR